MLESDLRIRPVKAEERPTVEELLARRWGSPQIVSRGRVHDAAAAEALGAFRGQELVGLATYELSSGECELLTLDALERRTGVGSQLLDAVAQEARSAGCRRLWLITTNDNAGAIHFYERRGMKLVAVHRGAVDQARKLKPSIPELAEDGTPISDELEFELVLED
jgi:GNAT superfamily N-acetyltransferase